MARPGTGEDRPGGGALPAQSDGLAVSPSGGFGSVGSPSGRNRGGGKLGEVAGVIDSGRRPAEVSPTGAGSGRTPGARSASGHKPPMRWTVVFALTLACLITRRLVIIIRNLGSRTGPQDVKEARRVFLMAS